MKTILFTSAIFYSAFIFSQTPLADFSVNKTTGCNPLTIEFINNSQNASSFFWDFGDGTISTDANPSNIYYNPGNYSITLIAKSTTGISDTLSIANLIVVSPMPVSSFSIPNNQGCVNSNSIVFVNNSINATTSFWDFGDGTTSTQNNPSHTYSGAGVFTVVHIAKNNIGCSDVSLFSNYIIISSRPSAGFTVDASKWCSLDHNFIFNSDSADMASYNWNFGDGNISTLQNPTHQYSQAGQYNITLQVTNQSGCSNSLTKNGFIKVSQELFPEFFAINNIGCAPLNVGFSSNMASTLDFNWNFGNGDTSGAISPNETYSDIGIYDVSLIVTDQNNCSYMYIADSSVNTNDPLKADFNVNVSGGCAPLNVVFSDLSINAISYLWDFGDGTVSTQKNPVHVYQAPGIYSVSLQVADAGGCESFILKSTLINIKGSVPDFLVSDSNVCAPATINFSDNSTNATQWLWNFGDGTTSTLQNPSHLYNTGGVYTVSLTTSDSSGCSDTKTKDNFIHSYGAEISYNNTVPVYSCGPITASFNGSSIGNNFFLWDFGDSTYSSLANPSHTFSDPGYYTVSLTTKAANGCTVTIANYNEFEIGSKSIGFLISTDTCPGYSANFTDTSTDVTGWLWNFGDGSTSSLPNPTHTYSNPGFYSVSLTATTSGGCTFSLLKSNGVEFQPCGNDSNMSGGGGSGGGIPGTNIDDTLINPYQITGCAPFGVAFTNPMDSAILFYWNFGDGFSSALENPFHEYLQQGIYDIILVVQYVNQEIDSIVWNNFIKVNKVESGFLYQQNNGCNFGNVILNDTSVNSTNSIWQLGDNSGSAIQNPTHDYLQSGNYLITLLASDEFGCNSISANNIFAGAPSPVLDFDRTVCINDTVVFSSNLAHFDSYQWNFGNGGTSAEENSFYAFDSSGIYYISLTVFDSNGCSIMSLPDSIIVSDPVAGFSIPVQTGCKSLNAIFNNLSANADIWHWDFGDGATSALQNPVHTYLNAGTYSVSLIAEKNGCTNELSLANSIEVFNSEADFSFTQDMLCLPLSASFSDSSMNAVSWQWNFGDGTADSVQNPVHLYSSKPNGNITLSITDINGCSATISKPNINVFSAMATASATKGCDSLNVNFTDKSKDAVAWLWDFGDSSFSSAQNPSHFYSDSGSYSVNLIAESPDGCSDTIIFPDLIVIYKVIADFSSASVLAECNPLPISFSDNSLNATTWKWNFGDGGTSTQKNPFHIYIMPAIYDVTLVAGNSAGCTDTITRHSFIDVTGPVAAFTPSTTSGCSPLSVQFIDSSDNNANFYTWYFSDGDSSHAQNPVHEFSTGGQFSVSLLVEDSAGCGSYFTYPQKIDVHHSPEAAFNISAKEGCEPLSINVTVITEHTDSTLWNFGNGNQEDSGFIYQSAGTYFPFFVASNSFGCIDTFNVDTILVHPAPVADFFADSLKGCSPLNVNFYNNSENLNDPSFSWNFGNSLSPVDTNKNSSILYTEGGLFDVSLIVTNSFGCSDTLSRHNYIRVYDDYAPEASAIDVVTVSSDSSVYIVWERSNSADFKKFVLYRKNNFEQNYTMIAEFNDPDILSYSDENLNTLKFSYCYKLQSVDFCENKIDLTGLTENCTMNVTARADSATINVTWTPYVGCSISAYLVYRLKEGSSNYVLLADVGKNTLNYQDSSWDCSYSYSFKIKALDLCGNQISSFSDTSSARINPAIFSSQRSEIIRSTVFENSSVFMEWNSPEFAPEKVLGYKIYRSPGNQKFEHIATVPADAHSYLDTNVKVTEQNYYYKVEPTNTCLVKSLISNNASSILLNADREGYEVKLKWTPYKNWENGVEYYIIEKQDENGNWKTVKIVDGSFTEEKELIIE